MSADTELRLRALEAGHDLLVAQNAELVVTLAATQEELRRNSEITNDIRDILNAGRMGLKVLGGLGQLVRWLGIVAGGLAAIYAAYQAIKQGGDISEALRQAFTKGQ